MWRKIILLGLLLILTGCAVEPPPAVIFTDPNNGGKGLSPN